MFTKREYNKKTSVIENIIKVLINYIFQNSYWKILKENILNCYLKIHGGRIINSKAL